jgi:hypothetical protein
VIYDNISKKYTVTFLYGFRLMSTIENDFTMKTMKKAAYILLLLMIVNIRFLDAAISNPIVKSPDVKSETGISNNILAPSTPREALFSDSEPEPELNYETLKPMTPKEASFDDQFTLEREQSLENLFKHLSPVTPEKADFNDTEIKSCFDLLKPVTPDKAEFTEIP